MQLKLPGYKFMENFSKNISTCLTRSKINVCYPKPIAWDISFF